MANHVRRQLREAVAAALTGLATTGARVFQSRGYPLRAADLPGLLVSTPSETAEPAQLDGAIVRDVEVSVVAIARDTTDLDDTLDQMAKEIETVLQSAVTVAAVPILLEYDGADDEVDVRTDAPHGAVRLRYRARLYTSAPDALLNA